MSRRGGDVVRFQGPGARSALSLVALIGLLIVLAGDVPSVLLVVVGVVVSPALLVCTREGLVLTPEHADVVNPLRRRRIPWRDVQGVVLDHLDIVFGLADGERVTVLYPERRTRRGWRSYDRRVADRDRIWQWWVDHRGADWRPLTPPPPPGSPPVAGAPTVDEVWGSPPEARR
jgi:hypothetical protein